MMRDISRKRKFGKRDRDASLIEPVGKLAELVKALGDADRLLILTHNNPDPDSIAAAFGLRHALSHVHKAKVRIGYSGTVGRSENRQFVKLLRIPLREITAGQASRYKHVAFVDVNPGAKNTLPIHPRCRTIVIDHHLPKRPKQSGAAAQFQDLRPEYGATSTIVSEYIKENGIPLNARVATALYFGIKTDIGDRGRGHSEPDIVMTHFLFPRISLKWLWKIERTPVPVEYFMYFADAINNALSAGDMICSDLGDVISPDAVAEMADFLLKIKGIRWSMCIGRVEASLYFSIRTTRKGQKAGDLAFRLAGPRGSAGGHEQAAAGSLPLDGLTDEANRQIRKELEARFFKKVGRDHSLAVPFLAKKHHSDH